MMFGSFLYNLWIALISFTVYFFVTVTKPYAPIRIIIGSFVAAIIGFFVTYGIRLFIGYVLYTPNSENVEEFEENLDGDQHESIEGEEQSNQQNQQSTVEFEDESTEEIAQVVRTMMNSD